MILLWLLVVAAAAHCLPRIDVLYADYTHERVDGVIVGVSCRY